MAELSFEDISFEDKGDKIKINFLRIFSAELDRKSLEDIGKFKVNGNSIVFEDVAEQKAAKKFNFLLAESFKELKNTLTGQKTVYVHQNSGIPLIGHNAFGLIDRNTSIIEVRCITGCNLDCIYCSVTQDKRPVDFVVEKDYLVQEFKKLVDFKEMDGIEAHIGTQGEPLLYAPLSDLIRDLIAIPGVSTIALDTNGTMLTKEKVDELVDAGLTRFCFSINALDQKLAEKISGRAYDTKKIRELVEYIAEKDVELLLNPVWMKGVNDEEIPKIIELAKKLNCKTGIQNFLNYKMGKNPVKQMSWEEFIEKMKEFEKKYDMHLLFDFKEDFNVRETKKLPKPFRKGEIVKARLVLPGRLADEKIAVAGDRLISVYGCDSSLGSTVKLKITREKHNIFAAMPIAISTKLQFRKL